MLTSELSVIMVTIAVGIQDRPPTAPQDGIWVSDYKLVEKPSFTKAISAVSSIVYAYAGTPGEFSFVLTHRVPRGRWNLSIPYANTRNSGFFPIAAEMRDPSLYTKSLLTCQASVTAIYIAVGTVMYYYCGSYVASPALGSAGTLIMKISYGISLPGLVVSTIVVLYVSDKSSFLVSVSCSDSFQFPSKYVFVRILRRSRHLTNNSFIHWGTWLGCTCAITVSSYLIASDIPIFSDLVSLIGALLGAAMPFQPMGCMWLYDNWTRGRERPTVKWVLLSSWSILVIVLGTSLMVAGTYGSIFSIIASSKASSGASAWSCADNAN